MSMNENHDIQLVIITGMSGAGKPSPFKALRISAILRRQSAAFLAAEIFGADERIKFKMSKVALVMDLRGREFLTG